MFKIASSKKNEICFKDEVNFNFKKGTFEVALIKKSNLFKVPDQI
jgi:hypothetical protein